MLTIEDLKNPKLISGFHHVYNNKIGPAGGGGRGGYQGRSGAKARGTLATDWYGPMRKTAEEAAQDYCDYMNGRAATPAPSLKRADKAPRPTAPRRVVSEREKAAAAIVAEEKAKNPREKLHDPVCYLIGAQEPYIGGDHAVKIGHANDNVFTRLDDLQTGNHRLLVLLATLPGGEETEDKLHVKHAECNILNEWFRPSKAVLAEFGLTWVSYKTKLTQKATA